MRLAVLLCSSIASLLLARAAHAVPEAGFTEIINGEAPRDSFLLYRWEQYPDVYVIHFDSYLYQSRALSRMAMFQEMAASRGRIMSQAELEAFFHSQGSTLEGLFGAHDYDTEDMARFYNALWQSGEPLYAEERRVVEVLIGAGLLEADLPQEGEVLPRDASPFSPTGEHAVISFATRLALEESHSSVQGKPGLTYEKGALYHEMLHGIFFTDEQYAQRCAQFWQQQLSEDERRAFRSLLASLNYDPHFELLMINEFQAYLLTPDWENSGPNILLSRGRRLLSSKFQPEYVSDADKAHFAEHGPALLARIRDELGEELRDWLGEEYMITMHPDSYRDQ